MRLQTFKTNLDKELKEAIRVVSEGERKPPVSIDIRNFSRLDGDEQLVRDAIFEIVSQPEAEINVYKLWISFWWKCRIEVIAVSVPNKVNYIPKY